MSKRSLDALRLAPDSLTRPFAPEQFNFSSTDDLEPFRRRAGKNYVHCFLPCGMTSW